MTEPTSATAEDATPYTAPTDFTQVVVAKEINLDKLTTEVRAKAANAEVSLTASAPPPYTDANPAVLTVGTVGEGPSLDVLNKVVTAHKPGANNPSAPEETSEPTVNADPAVAEAEAPAPAPEPTPESAPAEEPAP